MTEALRRIVIAGGGSAGWMAAAALAQSLRGTGIAITLVESEEIGIVGVGEATIPPIQAFNRIIGVNEAEFVKATKGTFKLGIEFVDWWRKGEKYFHPFGRFGDDFGMVPFHQQWLAARAQGDTTPIAAYSLSDAAAQRGRFAPQQVTPGSVFATFGYAYHFDASLYAAYLRRLSEARGVVRQEGRIGGVVLDPESGFVTELVLEDGRRIEGDLFLDCTGFRGMLIGEALGTRYIDWKKWLPCDRAIAVPTERVAPPTPFTRSTAHDAGWQWRIPLQHRTGNGHVYASDFIDDQVAEDVLLANLDATPTASPRQLRFTTGQREAAWAKNVVSIGLSSGFLEPLESTSLHLIQRAITNLLAWFPDTGFDPGVRDEYNLRMAREFDTVRDFLILHYTATERDDTPFWRHCRAIELPDTLAEKIEMFRRTGRLIERDGDIFQDASWLAVMTGQGILPTGRDRLADGIPAHERRAVLAAMRKVIAQTAEAMPPHDVTLQRHFHAG